MFLSIEKFPFLKPILTNKDIFYKEYIHYKEKIKNTSKFPILKEHLTNLETYNLLTSFVMCISTTHGSDHDQIKNGLFNFNYAMPDRNFFSFKKFLEKKFDIYYKVDSSLNSCFFKESLDLINSCSIPNFVEAGYSEYKNGCIFDPHTHERKLIVAHFLLNPCDDQLIVTSGNDTKILNNDNLYIIFRGYELHSAVTVSKKNVVTLGLGFYEQ